MSYRDDATAAHAHLEALERELAELGETERRQVRELCGLERERMELSGDLEVLRHPGVSAGSVARGFVMTLMVLAGVGLVAWWLPMCGRAGSSFEARCQRGDLSACFEAGVRYQHGIGERPRAPEDAARFYARGCQAGSLYEARACTNLGVLYEGGDLGEPDPARAADDYLRGCQGGDGLGCNDLGVLVREGRASSELGGAEALYRQACAAGEPRGCDNLGALQAAADPAGAAQSFLAACTGGLAQGCARLAEAYAQGRGVPEDARVAALFRRLAAVPPSP